MRVRLLDYSDKRPHSQAPEWAQADLDSPKPQKIAETFFVHAQVRAGEGATPLYDERGSPRAAGVPLASRRLGRAGRVLRRRSLDDAAHLDVRNLWRRVPDHARPDRGHSPDPRGNHDPLRKSTTVEAITRVDAVGPSRYAMSMRGVDAASSLPCETLRLLGLLAARSSQ